MVPFDIDVSTVSWIDRKLMSIFSGMPNPITAGWVDLLCYGMYHTANPEPPLVVHGQKGAAPLEKKFRSFTTYSIQLQVGDDGKFVGVRQLPNSNTVVDAGYTPPFDDNWELLKGVVGSAITSLDPFLASKIQSEATQYSPGEKSSLSQIVLPGTQWQSVGISPLWYSSIAVSAGEVILGHSLIKFRAGTQGDYIGIVGMGAPNHLPWVWCEMILTYKGNLELVLYAAGSAFPCHAFYVDGEQKGRLDLIRDRNKLMMLFTKGLQASYQYASPPLSQYSGYGYDKPILTGVNAQVSTQETAMAGITTQPYTAIMNDQKLRRVIPLASLKCWE